MKEQFEAKLNINKFGDGFVFVFMNKEKNKNKEDSTFISIPINKLGSAIYGDIVSVEIDGTTERGEPSGRIINIVKRNKQFYVGKLIKENNNYIMIPSDHRINLDFIIKDNNLHSKDGKIAEIDDIVAVNMYEWKDGQRFPTGEIEKVLGKAGDNNAQMLSYAIEKGFDNEHEIETQREADNIKSKGIQESDYINRRDMRDVITFTIDPADAKDFDDAISYKQISEDKYEVGIHIADVSYYVRPGMSLDEEAIERETSVYLVDRCVPMLPEILSNDLCSLVEAKDRLVMSAIFEIDINGNIYNEWYGRCVINSDKRFTYEEAQEIMDAGGLFENELRTLNKLAKNLFVERENKGALVIETEEVKFKLDNNGHPIDVYIKRRKDVHKMIEELMLLANRKVSEYITTHQESREIGTEPVCIYRIHDKPDVDRMRELQLFIQAIGESVKAVDGIVPSKELNKLIKKLEGRKEKDLLSMHISKSMQKAVYSTKSIGHYGLAFEYYTHFTSPIRRYPDVLAHRLLMTVLSGEKIKSEYKTQLDKLCILASQREKDASDAERASIKHKQVEYMGDRIGQTFDGVISFISKMGIFIEDKKSKSEGVIKMSYIGEDYYEYDESHNCIRGERGGDVFRIGDDVKFSVVSVNLDEKQISYKLVR